MRPRLTSMTSGSFAVDADASRHHAALQIGLERVAVFGSFDFGLKGGEVRAIEQLVLDAKLDAAVAFVDVLPHGRSARKAAGSAATF